MREMLKYCMRIKNIRNKILVTFAVAIVYKLCLYIPLPAVNSNQVVPLIVVIEGLHINILDYLLGENFRSYNLMTLGLLPYFSISALYPLLRKIPRIKSYEDAGSTGAKKILHLFRFSAIILSFFTSIGLLLSSGNSILVYPYWYFYLIIALILCAGTAICLFLIEIVDKKGLGKGTTIIVLINIISAMVRKLTLSKAYLFITTTPIIKIVIIIALLLTVFKVVISMIFGERRIAVQYAKRVVGRKQYNSTYLPLKVDSVWENIEVALTGYYGLIIMAYLLLFPYDNVQALILFYLNTTVSTIILYIFALAYLILADYYKFNELNLSHNLQVYGGHIPGIRPGKPAKEFLNKINSRLKFGIISITILVIAVPNIVLHLINVDIIINSVIIFALTKFCVAYSRELDSMILLHT